MTAASWLQLAVLIVLILGGTRLLGPYIAGIFTMPADAAAAQASRDATGAAAHTVASEIGAGAAADGRRRRRRRAGPTGSAR